MMKYIPFVFALVLAVNVNAQSGMLRTPKGALYQIFTHNTGEKLKDGNIITFQYIQKTDKDSVLYSTYASGHVGQARIQPSQNVADLMEIFPLLTVNDSLLIKIPTDSLFKNHEDKRPPFFPKSSSLNFVIKILKAQSMEAFMADIKQAEITGANKYIAAHKLNLQTTASGLKYVVTQASVKPRPLKGDTVLVNYVGKGLDDKVFDTSIEAVAQASGLQQPGRHYEPLSAVIGAVGEGAVIAGWNEALLLLHEGSKATFVIPSALAYGPQGNQGIAPFSTLIFDLEVVKIKAAKHVATAIKGPVKKPPYKKKVKTKKN
jgi:FKBP-type peptidyl-prolyl cis-trans isomerase FkpA